MQKTPYFIASVVAIRIVFMKPSIQAIKAKTHGDKPLAIEKSPLQKYVLC